MTFSACLLRIVLLIFSSRITQLCVRNRIVAYGTGLWNRRSMVERNVALRVNTCGHDPTVVPQVDSKLRYLCVGPVLLVAASLYCAYCAMYCNSDHR